MFVSLLVFPTGIQFRNSILKNITYLNKHLLYGFTEFVPSVNKDDGLGELVPGKLSKLKGDIPNGTPPLLSLGTP